MFRRALYIALLSSFISIASLAQDPAPPVPQRLVIHSNVLNEDRIIWVRLPRVSQQGHSKCPVLYLLDGDAHTNEIGPTIDFLVANNRMPPMIVVGIVNTDRNRDLTPTRSDFKRPDGTIAAATPTSGGGDKFLDFIQSELIPEIEKRYPTQPFRVFAGHSLGGLLAVHALITRPNLFHAFLAVSPSLQWDDGHTLHQAQKFFASQAELKKILFLSVANEEPLIGPVEELEKTLRSGSPKSFVWNSAHYSDEDHGSTVLRAHYAGLRTVFAGWPMPRIPQTGIPVGGLVGVEKHYRELSTRYGFPVSAEEEINGFGYGLIFSKQVDEAVAALKRNVELYPESANVYDSLADAYEASGKLELARQNVEKAVEVAARNGDSRLSIFNKHLERVTAATKIAPAKIVPAP